MSTIFAHKKLKTSAENDQLCIHIALKTSNIEFAVMLCMFEENMGPRFKGKVEISSFKTMRRVKNAQ